MLPIIEVKISESRRYDFKKNIHGLLKFIPCSDLAGLQKISILDRPCGRWSKSHETSRGAYWKRTKNEPVAIELYYTNLYSNAPVSFFLIPFLPQHSISYTLFHEIGHHVQRMKHGIDKHKREQDAEAYANKYYQIYLQHINRFRFLRWPLYVILVRPFYYKSNEAEITKLKDKIRGDDRDYTSITELAKVYFNCGYFNKSVKLCKEALKINSNYIDAHRGLASVWLRKTDYKKARKYVEKILLLDADDKTARKWQKVIEDKLTTK